jgi:hypothetical protein
MEENRIIEAYHVELVVRRLHFGDDVLREHLNIPDDEPTPTASHTARTTWTSRFIACPIYAHPERSKERAINGWLDHARTNSSYWKNPITGELIDEIEVVFFPEGTSPYDDVGTGRTLYTIKREVSVCATLV